jgi:hypothetical protein
MASLPRPQEERKLDRGERLTAVVVREDERPVARSRRRALRLAEGARKVVHPARITEPDPHGEMIDSRASRLDQRLG